MFKGKYKELKNTNDALSKTLKGLQKQISEGERNHKYTIKKYSYHIKRLTDSIDGNKADIQLLNERINLIKRDPEQYQTKYIDKKILSLNNLELKEFSSIFKNVKKLNLDNNKIAKIDFLTKFTALEELSVSNNDINDISFISNEHFKYLSKIDLNNN